MIKIRLQGLPQDVDAAAAVLRAAGTVLEESSDYANRGTSRYVRRYLDVQFDAATISITRSAGTTETRLALPAHTTPKDPHHGR